ncbi:IucA/IucC family C-terminal-domain containing protein [Metabacillus sediminilitoris]|uniref:Iron reductase n=1 Tax=Metabacillus sediminilitoris TaxID=2567941 RepID=A0A4S4C092_9BACI|nr:IucA/IucC family C-terminal-domain containing protein [Metabacillus sediminilitoris]QGQ48866.1 iron reductase [Metabacillus sediminilitoris]THF80976.1 iron reductase [Metabacillus sediminilitoris]
MAELTKTEINSLSKYRLSTEHSVKDHTFYGSDLLNPVKLKELFEGSLQHKLNTNNQHVIGSMLVKRYAFLAALVLNAMSLFNKGINCSLHNMFMQTDEKDPLWLPNFYFEDKEVTTPEMNRAQWRTSVVQTLFLENIEKVITTISKQAKVSKVILWENIAIYIFWMYETVLQDPNLSDEVAAIVQEDFHYVVMEAPPLLFGTKARNPLTQFYQPKQNDIRMRKTCCLFYLTSKNHDRCQTCPIECKK